MKKVAQRTQNQKLDFAPDELFTKRPRNKFTISGASDSVPDCCCQFPVIGKLPKALLKALLKALMVIQWEHQLHTQDTQRMQPRKIIRYQYTAVCFHQMPD